MGAGGLRGATPRSRSGGVAMRIPLDQVKRNPSKMVGVVRGHRRAGTLNHNHGKLANLVTQTTALSNSMKLSHAVWGHQRRMGHGGEG